MELTSIYIAVTFIVFYGAKKLQSWCGKVWVNPILITILVIIGILKLTGHTYEEYSRSGRMIEFWLKPAIVALGVPLYSQLKAIRRQWIPVLMSQVAGCVAGILSAVLLAKACGASRDVIISLAPKSVSTPIAVEISSKLGGIPSLTAAIVVLVGLLGAILGLRVLELGHIGSPVARSLSMGTAAHVMGTNRVSELGDKYGAYATVGLILNGILTAILAGPLLRLVGIVT